MHTTPRDLEEREAKRNEEQSKLDVEIDELERVRAELAALSDSKAAYRDGRESLEHRVRGLSESIANRKAALDDLEMNIRIDRAVIEKHAREGERRSKQEEPDSTRVTSAKKDSSGFFEKAFITFMLSIPVCIGVATMIPGLVETQRERKLTHTAGATWTANVTSARGLFLPPGETCTIEARLRSTGHADDVQANARIKCGGLVLYDRYDRGLDVMPKCAVEQHADAGSTSYMLRCADPGKAPTSRDDDHDPGHAAVSIDSGSGTTTITGKNTQSPFQVVLRMPQWSAPVFGTAKLID